MNNIKEAYDKLLLAKSLSKELYTMPTIPQKNVTDYGESGTILSAAITQLDEALNYGQKERAVAAAEAASSALLHLHKFMHAAGYYTEAKPADTNFKAAFTSVGLEIRLEALNYNALPAWIVQILTDDRIAGALAIGQNTLAQVLLENSPIDLRTAPLHGQKKHNDGVPEYAKAHPRYQELTEAMHLEAVLWESLNDLRSTEEGCCVTLNCANPEGTGPDNETIEISASWTGWDIASYSGVDLTECFNKAKRDRGFHRDVVEGTKVFVQDMSTAQALSLASSCRNKAFANVPGYDKRLAIDSWVIDAIQRASKGAYDDRFDSSQSFKLNHKALAEKLAKAALPSAERFVPKQIALLAEGELELLFRRVLGEEFPPGAQVVPEPMSIVFSDRLAFMPTDFSMPIIRFASAMYERMVEKAKEGWGGWGGAPTEKLIKEYKRRSDAGKLIDAANYAMMLFERGITKVSFDQTSPPSSASCEQAHGGKPAVMKPLPVFTLESLSGKRWLGFFDAMSAHANNPTTGSWHKLLGAWATVNNSDMGKKFGPRLTNDDKQGHMMFGPFIHAADNCAYIADSAGNLVLKYVRAEGSQLTAEEQAEFVKLALMLSIGFDEMQARSQNPAL